LSVTSTRSRRVNPT